MIFEVNHKCLILVTELHLQNLCFYKNITVIGDASLKPLVEKQDLSSPQLPETEAEQLIHHLLHNFLIVIKTQKHMRF